MKQSLKIATAGIVLSLAFAVSAFAQDTASAPPAEPAAAAAVAPAPVAEPAPAEAAAPAAEAAPEAAAAPAAPETAAPGAETGRIIFFRPSRLSGAVYTYTIREVGEDGDVTDDSPRIGRLSNGSYFEYEAPAGIHNYNISGPMAVNKNEDRIRMEVEPGETYYVEQSVRMGLITGGFRLVPADQARYARHDNLDLADQQAD